MKDNGLDVSDRATVLNPNDAMPYESLGMMFQRKQALCDAASMFCMALDIEKDNYAALLGLFRISCQTNTFSQVRHYLEVYLKEHTSDTAMMFCLAAVDIGRGCVNKAKKTLKEILAIEPGHKNTISLLEKLSNSNQCC